MYLSLGKRVRDIVRYVVVLALFISGFILTIPYGKESQIVYVCLAIAATVQVKIKEKFVFLAELLLPIYSCLVALYIGHIITSVGHKFYIGFQYRSVFKLMNAMGIDSYIYEVFIIVALYNILRLFRVPSNICAIIAAIPTTLLCVADYFVYQFRNSEMSPIDLTAIGTAFNVAGNYTFPFKIPYMFVYAPAILFIISLSTMKIEQKKVTKKDFKSYNFWADSFIYLTVSVLTIMGIFFQISFTKLFTRARIWGDEPSSMNGYITNFVLVLDNLNLEKPEGYNKKDFSNDTNVPDSIANKDQDVNIIVIMNESYMDFSMYESELNSYNEPAPYWKSLAGLPNVRTGTAFSSVYGGVTANSEYEALTGITLAGLPEGVTPYSMYLNKPAYSLPRYLSDLGYDTYAIHPYEANGWNRPMAYPNLGFDHALFMDDMDIQEGDIIRGSTVLNENVGFMSDMSAYRNILRLIDEEETDGPDFYFMVTIQNHAGYNPNLEYYDYSLDWADSPVENLQLNVYLSNVHKSDNALQMLLTTLEESDEKYVVVVFGDHQPSLICTADEPDSFDPGGNKWKVPYLVWSNFDMPEGYGAADRLSSLNYISIDVLEAAGIPLNGYFQRIADVRNNIPSISYSGYYSNIDETWRSMYDKDSDPDNASIIDDYYKLQYYALIDYKPEK